MKRILIAFGIVIVAGCTGREQAPPTNTEPVSQSASPSPSPTPSPSPAPPPAAPSQVTAPSAPEVTSQQIVEQFGTRMKNVSLLAPHDVLVDAIRANYADLVTPGLLAQWLKKPEAAPGRTVSSPWPDHIDIRSTSDDGRAITGSVVEMTSSGKAGERPIRITLEHASRGWLISAVQIDTASETTDDPKQAADVIRRYYDAIGRRDFKAAYRLWGETGPPHQSEAQFARGFEDTKSVSADVGAPGRIDAAAGSRYVQIPVVVTAITTSGERQRFEGSYTVRRSVVDGATEAQRQWHIYSASLQRK